jgi:Zn-dependent protease
MDQRTKRTLWTVAIAVFVVALVVHHNITTQEIIIFCVVVPSIILHEISHGYVANAFGDDTAKRAGRLSLNPLVHVDPLGTLIVPALLSLSTFGVIGWAKPVPVNVGRLKSPRNEGVLVSLAGPAVNAVLAALFALVFVHVVRPGIVATGNFDVADQIVYNMIPIPPLDGSVLFERLLPARYWPTYLKYRRFTMPVLMGIVLLNFLLFPHGNGPINWLFARLYSWWSVSVLHSGFTFS